MYNDRIVTTMTIERRLKGERAPFERNRLPNNGGLQIRPAATRFLSLNRLYHPVTDYQFHHSPRIYLDARNMPPAGATRFEIRKSYDNKPLFAGLQHTVLSRRYCAPCTCSLSLSLFNFRSNVVAIPAYQLLNRSVGEHVGRGRPRFRSSIE